MSDSVPVPVERGLPPWLTPPTRWFRMRKGSFVLNAWMIFLICGVGSLGTWKQVALAQSEPDIRNIRPAVMLLVDTSGSMERLPTCVCPPAGLCESCEPTCEVGNYEKNRWSTLLEVMTGDFDTFTCEKIERSTYAGDFDENYFIAHYRPPVGLTTQNDAGILDVYEDRVRFGLMTFDGIGTLSSRSELVEATQWTTSFIAESEGANGMYSYGGHRTVFFPGCVTDFAIDNGARSDNPAGGTGAGEVPGNLVSVGAESDDHELINARIQQSLLNTRPFGPTPTAAMLDDYRYYLNNNEDVVPQTIPGGSGDPYFSCRSRYAILITDGYPNADFRDAPYECDTPGFTCPYDTPEDIATDLCAYSTGSGECTGLVDGVFVVGFDVADTVAKARLDDIADMGGTGQAFFAANATDLKSALASALDQANPGATTRTVPAFITSSDLTGAQFQFNTGFLVPDNSGEPWTGVLERRRFECDGTNVVERPILEAEDDLFHEELNNRSSARTLYTVLPANAANANGWITGRGDDDIAASLVPTSAGSSPVETGLNTTALNYLNPALTPEYFGVTTGGERDALISWVRADAGSPREDMRLGSIYHSSPVVMRRPELDLADEAFNLFRLREDVVVRPNVIFVGSNDGVLHAFAVEDQVITTGPSAGTTIAAGEELWGFVPPALLSKIKDATVSHQWMVDGTPVVREMFYARTPGQAPTDDQYHSVLVVGLRAGGDIYFALDVSEPISAPKFLWQFTTPTMGETYAEPALTQVLTDVTGTTHERAVAILPGGHAAPNPGSCPVSGAAVPTPAVGLSSTRTDRRCWGGLGRELHVLDVSTGLLLKSFGSATLPAPVTGGASMFPGETGAVATRGFVTDDDGVIWRLDLSSQDPANWELVAFHDLFHDQAYDAGQPAYGPPVLSTDDAGRVVVLQATGNIDLLDSTDENRAVSLTENVTFDTDGTVTDVGATFNWEITFDPGQQVTGPLELFGGVLYFGTFTSNGASTNACSFGSSRIWGVDYVERGTGGLLPAPGLESTPGSGTLDALFTDPPLENQIVMGVAITQRPTCFLGEVELDAYLGNRYRVTQQGGGQFQLVAQVSGGGTAGTGGTIAEISRNIPAPQSYTRVGGWAGFVD